MIKTRTAAQPQPERTTARTAVATSIFLWAVDTTDGADWANARLIRHGVDPARSARRLADQLAKTFKIASRRRRVRVWEWNSVLPPTIAGLAEHAAANRPTVTIENTGH